MSTTESWYDIDENAQLRRQNEALVLEIARMRDQLAALTLRVETVATAKATVPPTPVPEPSVPTGSS